MQKQISGLVILVVIALASTWLSQLVEVGGKNPLEASALVVVIGLLINNLFSLPNHTQSGIKAGEKILVIGIVLFGASLDFKAIVSQGPRIIAVIIITMVVGFISTLAFSALLKLPPKLSTLLAAGTTICGGTAIAVIAPLIRAKEDETSYAIGVITLWGVIAILLYPEVAQFFSVSDNQFGIFAGTAIHSTPQVIGAGFIFSDAAGKTATAVKLVRNCFIAPLAFILAFHSARRDQATTSMNLKKAFPWFLFGYFIMAGLATLGIFSKEVVDAFTSIGKFFILLGMAGVGLQTSLRAFGALGIRPVIVGLLGALVVAAVSAASISFLITT